MAKLKNMKTSGTNNINTEMMKYAWYRKNNPKNDKKKHHNTIFKKEGKHKPENLLCTALKLHIQRLPNFLDKRLTDGGKVVSPTCRPIFTPPGKFLLLISVSG
jgi:uncharacterized protein (DUF927 family)